MRTPNIKVLPGVIVVAVLLNLGACSKQVDDRTVGEKVDATIAKVEQKTDQAIVAVKSSADAASAAAGPMLESAKVKLTDAAITTSITAELARDPALSALKINVDTNAGRVALHGTAPDDSSRNRATVLAHRVDGVVAVDNMLEVPSH